MLEGVRGYVLECVNVRERFQKLRIVLAMSDDEGQLVGSHSQIFTQIF